MINSPVSLFGSGVAGGAHKVLWQKWIILLQGTKLYLEKAALREPLWWAVSHCWLCFHSQELRWGVPEEIWKKKKKRRIHMETASKVDVPTSSLHLPWHQAVLLFLAISSLYRGNSLKASKPSLSSKSFRTRHGIQNPQPVSTALVFQTTQHQVQSSDQLFTSNHPLQEEEEKQ